jgi:hypothetical protein
LATPGSPGADTGTGAAAETLGSEAANPDELRREIMQKITEQVKQLLLDARKDTEAKVKAELKPTYEHLQRIDSGLDQLLEQLD